MMKQVEAVLILFLVLPIWFYLVYKILVAVQATELMWFLFWIYLPAVLLTRLIAIIENADKKP